jgi:hypothetical protein
MEREDTHPPPKDNRERPAVAAEFSQKFLRGAIDNANFDV